MGRKAIRDATKTLLEAAALVASGRVHIGKWGAIDQEKLPAICILTLQESIEPDTMGSRGKMLHTLDLLIECYAAETSSKIEEVLDGLSESVKTALYGSGTLSGTCEDILPTSVTYDINGDGAKPLGCAECHFSVLYYST